MLDNQIHHLTCILKLFEQIELTHEVADISVLNLKQAEMNLLFTTFCGQWYNLLIELYEYLLEKIQDIPTGERMDVVVCVCGVEHLLTL
jgi:hypothetical protein